VLLDASGVSVTAGSEAGQLLVEGLGSRDIGRVAAAHDIALVELTPRGISLEEAFMELTRDSAEYVTADTEEVML
ncbi:hypothetical protein ACMZ42_27040, partial [Lysinibacillus sp. NPDC056185]